MDNDDMKVAIVYTACQNCDHEAEFRGIVHDDTAYFPCFSCETVFILGSISGWSTFFDEDEDNNQ